MEKTYYKVCAVYQTKTGPVYYSSNIAYNLPRINRYALIYGVGRLTTSVPGSYGILVFDEEHAPQADEFARRIKMDARFGGAVIKGSGVLKHLQPVRIFSGEYRKLWKKYQLEINQSPDYKALSKSFTMTGTVFLSTFTGEEIVCNYTEI